MKEILKIMRFDFLTAKPFAMGIFIIGAVLFFTLSLIFSPIINAYISFVAMIFVMPLQSVADKSDFNKLYGILPVKRSNITRARFLYIFLVIFASEILEFVLAVISKSLKLYRLLPNQNAETMQMVKNSFEDKTFMLIMIFGIFTVFGLLFLYMEMMGQIYGRENEFKIIMITMIVLTVLLIGFFALSDREIIPTIKLPSMPSTVSGYLLLGAVLNVVMLGISLLFGEITVNKLAKREL